MRASSATQLVDVERASNGQASPPTRWPRSRSWDAFASWAAGVGRGAATGALDEAELGPPVPRPAKVFAIGLNYKSHAQEAGLPLPSTPMVFTKFPNCLVGPRADVVLSSDYVDWEVELVVVLGRRAYKVPEAQRVRLRRRLLRRPGHLRPPLQFSDQPPQFSMGKSIDTFGPHRAGAGVDRCVRRSRTICALTCDVAGERMQDARSSEWCSRCRSWSSYLSGLCTLEPGDIIFTGTPAGVGSVRNPRRYLQPGEEIVSTIEHRRSERCVNRCVSRHERA